MNLVTFRINPVSIYKRGEDNTTRWQFIKEVHRLNMTFGTLFYVKMSFVFDKETPSCFSNRVSKVRRTNITEKVKLQREIKSLEAEQSLRHYQLHKEKQSLMKELSKTKEIKDVAFVGLQRRKRLPLLQTEDFHSTKSEQGNYREGTQNFGDVSKPRSNSAPVLPSITCRCAVTGCRVRTRKISRGSSSVSLPVTREELELNNFGFEKATSYSRDLGPLCEDEHDVVHEVQRPLLRHRHSTSCRNDWNKSSMSTGSPKYSSSKR